MSNYFWNVRKKRRNDEKWGKTTRKLKARGKTKTWQFFRERRLLQFSLIFVNHFCLYGCFEPLEGQFFLVNSLALFHMFAPWYKENSQRDFVQVVLVPSPYASPVFQGPDGQRRRQQFTQYRCLEYYHLEALRPRRKMPETCKSLIFSLTAIIYDGGLGELWFSW